MAKRKYVKENNLVKAINTDSLELKKPLANEYYDINIHNSNMDKIDLAIKQNKNNISENKTSILSIKNLENEEVEVRKIETEENFIAVEDTKNGYFTDIKLEGKTLVVNENNEVVEAGTSGATIKSVGQDVNEISVLSTGHNEFNVLGNGHSEKTIYAFTNNSTDEFLDKIIPYVKYFNNVGSYDKCNNLFDYYFSDGDINVWINLGSFNREEALLNLNCKIAEINKKQDKKRILYYNSDTKAWEKPVLREWDSIEKHSDGKYYYHIRSEEVDYATGDENKTDCITNKSKTVKKISTEKVYECTNLDLISYSGETNYIVNTGAITPKSSFNVSSDISNVVTLLQKNVNNVNYHQHDYQRRRLTENNGNILQWTGDLNTCTKTGFYGTTLNTPNAPDSNYWFVEVYGIDNRWVKQVATQYNRGNVTYIRTCANYVWNKWERLTTTSTYSLLEEQVATLETQATENEKKISILESENKELREELTQIQTSIASLITTLEEK